MIIETALSGEELCKAINMYLLSKGYELAGDIGIDTLRVKATVRPKTSKITDPELRRLALNEYNRARYHFNKETVRANNLRRELRKAGKTNDNHKPQ